MSSYINLLSSEGTVRFSAGFGSGPTNSDDFFSFETQLLGTPSIPDFVADLSVLPTLSSSLGLGQFGAGLTVLDNFMPTTFNETVVTQFSQFSTQKSYNATVDVAVVNGNFGGALLSLPGNPPVYVQDGFADFINNADLVINAVIEPPEIQIVKLTNGTDNDTPTGPIVPVGSTVTWTYNVTNPGNEPIDNVVVTDDNGTPLNLLDDFNPAPTLVGGFNVGDLNTDNLLDPGELWVYTASALAVAGQYENYATVTGTSTIREMPVEDDNPDHYFGADPAIQIVKLTNGTDNDTPTGPIVPVGNTVTWTYNVTNPGNEPIANVVVTDDNGTPLNLLDDFNPAPTLVGGFNVGDLNTDNLLDPGELWVYTASALAVAGQYENYATVTGTSTISNTPLEDDNPDHYFGAEPESQIVKLTNGTDNDTPTGPVVPVGSTVTWTYNVTNPGNEPIANVVVTDDNGTPLNLLDDFNPAPTLVGGFNVGDLNTDNLLDPGELWVYTASALAVAGQYENYATVTGTSTISNTPLEDDNPDHYFGADPEIQIVKLTNGTDNDTPTGPIVPVGSTVTWTYNVTNPGNEPIANVVVTDDNGTPLDLLDDFNPAPTLVGGFNVGDLNTDNLLDPGELWVYTASALAVAGQYENYATVTGTSTISNTPLEDDNPDHYFGAEPEIQIVKLTNGTDNDTPTGPIVPVGSTVTWTYNVTNPGNEPIANVVVTDDNGTPLDLLDDFNPAPTLVGGFNVGDLNTDNLLDPGELWVYTASALAVAGQYENYATVTGTSTISNTPLEDDNPDHYFGAEPEIQIVKLTNGTDNDTPTGPIVPVGSTVTWTYNVTNPGNEPIANVVVTDDNGTPLDLLDDFNPAPTLVGGFNVGDLNTDNLLDPGELWVYTASALAVAGQYENYATVTGTSTISKTRWRTTIRITTLGPSRRFRSSS
jgi:large repetitive protein